MVRDFRGDDDDDDGSTRVNGQSDGTDDDDGDVEVKIRNYCQIESLLLSVSSNQTKNIHTQVIKTTMIVVVMVVMTTMMMMMTMMVVVVVMMTLNKIYTVWCYVDLYPLGGMCACCDDVSALNDFKFKNIIVRVVP